ncbi:hypothetical protein [Pseudalkalibacillus berkeleyi]|uniref:Uncharacterized protein n=1 Tax=Pseudalkalibacillus berkeleyi TaxID=1069813 RepID=A0ABS9GXI8_9BACL|nr:hypothetical protein [Pseudalkalibacillus berkeleyi]MCF6136531.1 hypothetical protein [Pseudalkalibacillus berkeleyi]
MREKQIKIFVAFVAVAFVVSLIMNVTFLSKLSEMDNRLRSLSSSQQNMMSSVNGQTNHIQTVLNDMQEEQRWMTPIDITVDSKDMEDGKAEATFEWQVKELQEDSEVVFYYTYGNNESYKALPVEEIQQGLFKVKVPIEMDMEPMWHINLMRGNKNTQESSKKKMEEQMKSETLKYYVTVSYGDMVKSGKVHTEHLGEYGNRLYGSLQTDIIMEDKTFSMMLMNHQTDTSVSIVKAYLLKYKDEDLLGREKFDVDKQYDPADPRMNAYHVNQIKQFENMRLVVQVVYDNGEVFEKEVYKLDN